MKAWFIQETGEVRQVQVQQGEHIMSEGAICLWESDGPSKADYPILKLTELTTLDDWHEVVRVALDEIKKMKGEKDD